MQFTYVVHSAVRESVSVKAMVGDREIDAPVPGLTVEMVEGGQHSLTRHFVPQSDEEMREAEAMFSPGSPVVVTFSKPGDQA